MYKWDARNGLSLWYDMGQVEVGPYDVRVLLDAHGDGSSDFSSASTSTNEIVETIVGLESLLGDEGGMVPHGFIENLVELLSM